MKSLIEELKNNFEIEQTNEGEGYFRLNTDWFDTHNKAVDASIKMLKDKGYTKIILPYMPVPYILNDREGNHRGTVSIIEKG
jgi:hypothetical protein